MAEAQRVITEIWIDAGGSIAGAAQAVRAHRDAEMAANKLSDTEEKARRAREKSVTSFTGVTSSAARLRVEYTNLQAKTDPVFAAQLRHQKELERAILITDAAVRRGLAGEQNAAETVARIRQQQIRDLQAVKDATQDVIRVQRAANDNVHRFGTANVAAQLQDVVVTSAMGMSPLQIALQQGTQLSAAFGSSGAAGAVKTLAAAFVSLVNPVSLVTIGLIAGTAALIQYFSSGEEESKSLDVALEAHAETIRALREAYGEAASGLREYVVLSKNVAQAQAIIDTGRLEAELKKSTDALVSSGTIIESEAQRIQGQIQELDRARLMEGDTGKRLEMDKQLTALFQQLDGADTVARAAASGFKPLSIALNAFAESARAGTPDYIRLKEAVSQQLVLDPSNEQLRTLAQRLFEVIDPGVKLQSAMQATADGIKLAGTAARSSTGYVTEFGNAIRELAGIAVPVLSETEKATEAFKKGMAGALDANDARAVLAEYEAALVRIQNQIDGAALPIPEARPSGDIAIQDELAERAARQEKANDKLTASYDRVTESAEERNARLRAEIEVVGLAGVEVDALRISTEMYYQAVSDGKELGTDQIAYIQQLAHETAKLNQELEVARTLADLDFERDQIGRSPVDRDIYATLRDLGLEINSIEGQRIADNIRINDELSKQQRYAEDVRDTLKEAASNFLQDLFSGKDVLESIVSIGARFAQMNFDRLVEKVSDGGIGSIFSAPQMKSAGKAIGTEIVNVIENGVDEWAGMRATTDGAGSYNSARLYASANTTGGAIGKAVVPVISRGIDSSLQIAAAAIRKIESGSYGGDYGAQGPIVTSGRYAGDRAYGAYQVMGGNIAEWTKEVLGSSMSIKQFLGDKSAQDAVFFTKFGQAVNKFGSLTDAVSVWFTGQPVARAGNVDDGYNTNSQYISKFNNALTGLPDAVKVGAITGTAQGSVKGVEKGFELKLGDFNSDMPKGQQTRNNGGMQTFGQMIGAGLGGFSTGYQGADPGMGALGGFLQGAATGNPVAAIIGGIAGFIGGILGAKKKLKAAQEALERQMKAINNLLAVGEGTGIGKIQKRLSDYLTEVDKAVELSWKAKNMELVKRLQNSFNVMWRREFADFEASFDGMIRAYRSGRGDDDPYLQGAEAMTALREKVRSLTADVRYFGESRLELSPDASEADRAAIIADTARKMAEVTEASRMMVLALISGTEEMTDMEREVSALRGAADAAQVVLEELGMSAYAAAEAINTHLNAALAKLRSQYIDDVSRSIYDLADMGVMGDLVDAQDRYNDRLRDAAALGLSADLANRELALSLRSIVKEANLTDDQIRQLAAALPQLSGGLLGLLGLNAEGNDTAKALADAQAKVEEAKAALRSAYEKERSELEATTSRLKNFIESIRDLKGSLLLDKALSPLDAKERLDEAYRQFRDAATKAMGTGDEAEAAQGRVGELSRAYLEELRSFYGSNEMYAAGFQEVQSILNQLETRAVSQLSTADQQLAALKAQIGNLIDIDDGVKSVSDAIADLNKAQADEAAAKAADDAAKAAMFEEMIALLRAQLAAQEAARVAADQARAASTATYSQTDPLANAYRSILKREPDAVGYAYYSGILNSGQATMDEIIADLRKHAAAAGIGMAGGGMVNGGVPGMDSVLRMLMPGEFVMPTAQTKRYETQLLSMHAGTFGAANDNSVVKAIMQLIERVNTLERSNADLLQRLLSANAYGFRGVIDNTGRSAEATEQQSREQSLQARKRTGTHG